MLCHRERPRGDDAKATAKINTAMSGHDDAPCCFAVSMAGEAIDRAGMKLPRQTRPATAGRSSDDGGIIRLTTFRNVVASVLSSVAAR